jgi:PAS domain S-box-containing protein
MVEDSDTDAKLLARELQRGGRAVTFARVEDDASMRAALTSAEWDVVTSDWSMPTFSAPAALALIAELGLDVPFIIVSGTIGEAAAVAAMRAGAHDYFIKGNLTRLLPAIERELREAEGRAARRRAEQELVKAAERNRALFECTPLPTWVFDRSSLKFLEVNEAAVRHYGYSREEFSQLTIVDIGLPEDEALLRRAAQGTGIDDGSWRHRRKDGTTISVELTTHDFELEGKAVRLMSSNDVSERRRTEAALRKTEEQLQQSRKMDAIGSLAGGIAHDFNNLLSAIIGYAGLALSELKPADPVRADIEQVLEAGQRAAMLTRQLLAFSRKQMLELSVLDLNDVVERMGKMFSRLIGENIQVTVVNERSLGRIHADAGQIDQVLLNLVVNARDAMPEGGKLTIETANAELDAAYAADHVDVVPGHYVMLSVSDTGGGMSEATRKRVFEPFFTTKEQGTGLGLATVFGIVKQSGGHIFLHSELGKGTTFRVYFPRNDQEPTRADSVPAQLATLCGSETVLLAEDNPQVCGLACAILRRNGYNVLEAPSGGDAFLICEQYASTIHLLLTDVVMPRMSGRQLAERLAPLRPDMKVLYMSGYSDDSIAHHGVLDAGIALIEKPLSPDALLRKVREVLDTP